MINIRRAINNIIKISDQEWSLFENIITLQTYNAKTQIVKNGSVARFIYFIEEGLTRVYHLSHGKEINTYFACDNQFISTYASIITQTPSHEILETIADSVILKINFQGLHQLFEKHPKFEKLGRVLAEKNYLCINDRTVMMQTQTAKEKYLNFINNHDQKIVQQIPQRFIASYLGITPESLSRVRKVLSISS